MKKLLIGLLVIVSVIAAGCSQPTVEEATETFCQNLQAFGDALANLESINATSTIGDLKDATAEVDDAWNQVTKSARELNEVKIDTIDESWKNLRQTVNQVDADDTIAAAVANVGVGLHEVKLAYEAVGQVHCPGLAPIQPPQAPAGDAATTAPATTEPAPPGFTGTFSSTLMLAGSATDMVLVLNEDTSVFVVMRPVDQATETIVLGRWQDNGDGTAAVTLTKMQDGQELATPETIVFRLDGENTLAAFQFDETVYGADGFSLQRMQNSAVAAETAAMAQQVGEAVTTTVSLTTTEPLTATPAITDATALPADLFAVPAEQTEPAAPAEAALADSPLGRTWQLQQITQNSGVTYTPVDPALYTVTFNADGTVNVLADCNTAIGTYQASDSGTLTIDLVTANAYCAAGSLSNQFISYLNVANSYEVEGDQLLIGFSNNYGFMNFTAAP